MTLSPHVSDHELSLLSSLKKTEASTDLWFHTFFVENPGMTLTLLIPPYLGGPELCKKVVLTKTNTNIFHGTLTADYFYNLGCSASDSFSFTAWSGIWSLTTDGDPTWCLHLKLQHVLSSCNQSGIFRQSVFFSKSPSLSLPYLLSTLI